MADFALPILTSTYSDLVDLLKARDVSSMKLFDGTTDSNLPSGTKRWNSTNSYFEKFDGSAWSPLVAKYMINVDLLDGCSVNDGGSSINDLWTADKITTQLSTKLNASSYTAADILTKIKTVDGSGSGLDADLLDGMNALSINTASSIVARDASGNFSAGTITATLNGNASTSTTATNVSGGSVNATTGAFTGEVTTSTQFVVGVGGDNRRGCIYSDTNWGMFFRSKIDNPAYAHYVWMNGAGSELMRISASNHLQIVNELAVGGAITVGSGKTTSSINMYDSDEGTRIIHCNSNNIGFLNQAGGWGSYCADNGAWISATSMHAPDFYGNLQGSAERGRVVGGNTYGTTCAAIFAATPSSTTSIHEVNGHTDAPNTGWWMIHSIRHTNPSNLWGTQIAYGWEDNANKIYQRNVSNGSWSAWYRVDGQGTAIGVGQTWTNVTSSRASGTTYTNSTGKPIEVSVWTTNWSDGSVFCYVNGNLIAYNAGHSQYGHEAGATFIVPNGATYSVNLALQGWWELR